MDVIAYGNQLINSGGLTWRRNSKPYQSSLEFNFLFEWPESSGLFGSDHSQEEIVYISAEKKPYQSPLHFAWRCIFYYRAFTTKEEILTTISETDYRKISPNEVTEEIRQASAAWLAQYKSLLPTPIDAFMIWNEWNDKYLVFSDADYYYAWNWNTSA